MAGIRTSEPIVQQRAAIAGATAAINDSGTIVVAWVNDGYSSGGWNRYERASGWESDRTAAWAGFSKLVLGADGTALGVAETSYRTLARSAERWTALTAMPANFSWSIAAMDHRFVAAGLESSGDEAREIRAQFLEPSWGSSAALDFVDALQSGTIVLDGAENGSSIVAWSGSHRTFSASIYDGAAWSAPVRLGQESTRSEGLAVFIASPEHAIAAWCYDYELLVRRGGAIGWDSAESFGGDDIRSCYLTKPVVDRRGNALVVWISNDGSYFDAPRWRRATAGSGWSAPALLHERDYIHQLDVFMDSANGDVLALWGDLSTRSWIARFE